MAPPSSYASLDAPGARDARTAPATAEEEPLQLVERGSEEVAEDCSVAPRSRRLPLLGAAAALLGLLLLGALFALPGKVSRLWSRCSAQIGLTELEARMVPSAGGRVGPLERQLSQASGTDIGPAEARLIVARYMQAGQQMQEAGKKAADQLTLEQGLREEDPEKFKQRNQAKCALQVTTLAEAVVKLGANVKSAVATCKPDPELDALGPEVTKLRRLICAVNAQFVTAGFLSLASNMANAAGVCSNAVNDASSLAPDQRIDARCAAGVISLVEALNYASMAGEIIHGGCKFAVEGFSEELAAKLKKAGMFDSHTFGGGDVPSDIKINHGRRLEDMEAEARRLFLGGGEAANIALCVADVAQTATQLGLVGVALDEAINVDCPDKKKIFGTTQKALPKPLTDEFNNAKKAQCGLDVSHILYSLGASAVYISMTQFHCTNHLNMDAICGAGVAGMEASLAGLAAAGQAVYLGCDVGQRANQSATAATKFSTKYATETVPTAVLHNYCQDMSLRCFNAWQGYLTPCAGGVSDTCPRVPTPAECPGVEKCRQEFAAWRPQINGTAWPQTSRSAFNRTVSATQACYDYLQCFATGPVLPTHHKAHKRKLVTNARRQLLQNYHSPARARVLSSMVDPVDQGIVAQRVPAEAGMELPDALWESIGENLTAVQEELAAGGGPQSPASRERSLRLLTEASELVALRKEDLCSQ